jgi:hypothetical protein
MAAHDMDIDERLKVLKSKQSAYWKASKSEKGRLLDMLEEIAGLDRKTIIRRLRGSCARRPRARQRGLTYGPEVAQVVAVVEEAFDWPAAERLQPHLLPYAQKLADHGHLTFSEETAELLGAISISTLQRLQGRLHRETPRPRRPRASPNPHRAQIPARRIPGEVQEPGYLEVDLVHHSGPATTGDYVHTLHLVDVATGWSEPGAVLGRSYRVVADGFRRCEERLPFPVREIHPDNGAEFLNNHMVRFWREHFPGATLSRSRPYHKDDNPFVEHRNGDLIRRWLGHERLDSVVQTLALNRFYEKLRVYFNFFHPVMRLVGKETNPETGRVRRTWDVARTPFERLREAGVLTPAKEAELDTIYRETDPLALHRELEREAVALFDLPGAQPGQTEDVHLTLDPTWDTTT